MVSVIIVAVFIVLFILVIRFITKDDTKKNKSNRGKSSTRDLTPKELSEPSPEEFADHLFEKLVPGKPVRQMFSTEEIKAIHDRKTKEAIAKVEFPSRRKILEESVNLIQTTKNIETLLGRYDIALESYFWIREQITNGVPIYFESKGNFPDELREYANFHIHRIAENIFSTYKSKISILKTDNAKENQKEKAVILLSECINSLKQTENTNEWVTEINDLQNRL